MRKLILIIESNELFRSTLIDFVEINEFNVISAEDGLSGLHLAKQFQPDLIICEIHLSKLNGFDVLNELRKDSMIANIPFIVITTNIDPNFRNRAVQLGVNDYLIKPLELKKLLEIIAKAIE